MRFRRAIFLLRRDGHANTKAGRGTASNSTSTAIHARSTATFTAAADTTRCATPDRTPPTTPSDTASQPHPGQRLARGPAQGQRAKPQASSSSRSLRRLKSRGEHRKRDPRRQTRSSKKAPAKLLLERGRLVAMTKLSMVRPRHALPRGYGAPTAYHVEARDKATRRLHECARVRRPTPRARRMRGLQQTSDRQSQAA